MTIYQERCLGVTYRGISNFKQKHYSGMEELDQISTKDKLSFKEHYFKIQYALEKVTRKSGSRVRASSASCSQNRRRFGRLTDI